MKFKHSTVGTERWKNTSLTGRGLVLLHFYGSTLGAHSRKKDGCENPWERNYKLCSQIHNTCAPLWNISSLMRTIKLKYKFKSHRELYHIFFVRLICCGVQQQSIVHLCLLQRHVFACTVMIRLIYSVTVRMHSFLQKPPTAAGEGLLIFKS